MMCKLRGLAQAAAALAVVLCCLALAAPPALADNNTDGFAIHWLGTGEQIAVCPAGDTLQWHDIPGKEYAGTAVPAQRVTCYLPSGATDPRPPWEGAGVREKGRLYPPPSAVGQAPWIADLADLGRISGMPLPQNLISSAINAWISSSATQLDQSLAGFFGSLTNMPLLVHVPIVLRAFAVSLVLGLITVIGRFAADLHRWSKGDPVADRPRWSRWAWLAAIMFGAPFAMDVCSVAVNGAVDSLWRAVLHTPAAPSGLGLMQMVGGGTGTALFPVASVLSVAGGILFLIVAAVLLLILGIILEAAVLFWLAVGAFAPLLVVWGMWSGGLESPTMRRIGTATARTLGFHTLMALFWLFMYGAASGVDQALGLGSRMVVLLLVAMALVASVFYWLVPVLRAFVAEDAGADALEQWAARAERLMTQVAAATGNARLAEVGGAWRARVRGVTDTVRDAAASPDRLRDAVVGASPHARGEALLAQYERIAEHPQALVRWQAHEEPDGRRYLVLHGNGDAVTLARREFETNVPLPSLCDVGGHAAVPIADRAAAEAGLDAAFEGVLVYWDSPLGPVTMRGGSMVRVGQVPPRAVCMGRWGE